MTTRTHDPDLDDLGFDTGDAKPKAKRNPKAKGAALRADITDQAAAVTRVKYFWIGALPTAPFAGCDIAGVNFNLATQRVEDGGKTRIPMIGSVVPLSEPQVERLRAKLPLTVIRFHPPREGDSARARRRGHLITMPSPEEQEAYKARGRMPHIYTPDPLDEPAADHLFAVPCADQNNPQQGAEYPAPLSETDLRW